MLKYIGKGNFIPNIPARDLSEGEVEKFGKANLIASGLYTEEAEKIQTFEKRTTRHGGAKASKIKGE